MSHQSQSPETKRLKITDYLLALFIITTGLFAYLWQKDKHVPNGFVEIPLTPFNDTEQIDPAVARAWEVNFDTSDAKKNTIGVSFLLSDLLRVVRDYSKVKSPNGEYYADRVLVRFIKYDKQIADQMYGKDPNYVNRISVVFWPYSKKDSAILYDNTPASKPLNLGDLHP